MKTNIVLDEVRTNLTGPIPTVRPPFDRDGRIDGAALARMIDFVIGAGARSVVLTAGDSHLIALSDREIGDLTKAVVDRVARRAMVVAADRDYHTRQAIEFATFAREAGADMLMLKPPGWAQSTTPETLADHYAAVAQQMPVMLVTNIFIPRGPAFGLETLRQTMVRTPNVLAVKDDMGGEFARQLCLLVHDRMAVWAGGQKQNHMNMVPYGADGYLSTFLTFKPDVAWRYWQAIEAGDTAAAVEVICDLDMPLFDFLCSGRVGGGFDAVLHGILELFGLAQRWRPKPYYSLSDEEMDVVRGFLTEKGLL